MKTYPFLLILAACGDNIEPLPVLDPLPSCTELGCDATVIDKVCAATGSCACAVNRTKGVPPVACAADCAMLPCDRLECGDASCTCAIGTSYVSCRG